MQLISQLLGFGFRGRLWVLAWLGFVLILTVAVSASEREFLTEAELRELTTEVLQQELQQREATLVAIAERITQLHEQRNGLQGRIDEANAQRVALEIPSEPEPITDAVSIELLQQQLEQWELRQQQLALLQTSLENLQALVTEQRGTLLQLVGEYGLAHQARLSLQPLLADVERRIQEGQLQREVFPPQLASLRKKEATQEDEEVVQDEEVAQDDADSEPSLWQQAERAILNWQAQAGRQDLRLQELQAALERAVAAQQQGAVAQQDLQQQLQAVRSRAALKDEVAQRSWQDLRLEFIDKNQSWHGDLESFTREAEDLERAWLAIQTQEAWLAEREAAEISVAPADASIPERLREVQQALAIAEAQRDSYQEQRAALDALEEPLTDLRSQIQERQQRLEDLGQLTLRLAVMLEVLQERLHDADERTLPDGADLDSLHERQVLLEQESEVLAQRYKVLAEGLEGLPQRLESAQANLDTAEREVVERQRRLESETRWMVFLDEVALQDTEALLVLFQERLVHIEETEVHLSALLEGHELVTQQVTRLAQQLNELRDPMVLERSQDEAAFTEWRRAQGIRITEVGLDEVASVTVAAAEVTQEPAAQEEEAESAPAERARAEPAARTEATIQQLRQVRNQMATRNLLALHERNTSMAQLAAMYESALAGLELLEAQTEYGVEGSREAWAAANILQERLGDEGLERAAISESVAVWTQREPVRQWQQRLDELQAQRRSLQEASAALQQRPRHEVLIQRLSEWESNLTRRIAALVERQRLEQQAEPPDVAQMDEFEQRRHDRFVAERVSAETPWHEKLLALLVAQQIEDSSQLLNSYYEQLLALEYRYTNLQQRKERSRALLERLQGSRDMLAYFIELLEPMVREQQERLEIGVVRVQAALNPAQAASLLDELHTRLDRVVLQLHELPQLPAATDVEAYQEARRRLIQSLRLPWAEKVLHETWLAWFVQQHSELGGLDQDIQRVNDHIAALESAQRELQLEISGLTGYSEAMLTELLAEGQTTRRASVEQLRLGDIGLLRQERLREMQLEAAKTAFWLLIIPVFAWIAIAMVNRMGRRAIRRARNHAAESLDQADQDREERVKMLVHVFTMAWKVLVVILATIYVFKAVNIDVLPIVASAGVLGLAIAFGAQQLVRDFLSGFFILLENQFRVGERVAINGVVGKVERITPRITLLRSPIEGTLHYIPNGSINHVSNDSREWGGIKVTFMVSYEAEHESVMAALQQAADDLQNDSRFAGLVKHFVNHGIENFGELAVEYLVNIQCKAGEQWRLGREYRRLARARLEEADIEIATLASLTNPQDHIALTRMRSAASTDQS